MAEENEKLGKVTVEITLTLEVDAEDWADAYGIPVDEVADDLKEYVASSPLGAMDAPITIVSWK